MTTHRDHEAEWRVLRRMAVADVTDVLDVQEHAAVVGLAAVFPQDAYPFPRETVGRRWRAEINDSRIDCYVVILDGVVAGFAATRQDEFLHFGIAIEHWGSGLATMAHDAVLERLERERVRRAWLTVFTANGRARRFYEKLGWQATSERTRSSFPPYPELLRYERPVGPII